MLDWCTFKMSIRMVLWFMTISLIQSLVDGAVVFYLLAPPQ